MHAVFDVMRRPTGRVFEQSNAANRAIIAKIKPVLRPFGDIDQITTLDLDSEDGSIRGYALC